MSRPALLAVGCALLGGGMSLAEDASPVEEAIAERRKQIRENLDLGLLDDWLGGDSWLRERGIRLEVALTGFAQDPWSDGGGGAEAFGGKLDALLRLDGQRLGLWEGLSLTVHSEYNFGESNNGIGGTVLPVNVAMQLPGVSGGSRYDTSSVFLTQRFNETFSLTLGKTNLADLAALHPYGGGAGLSGFMNGGLASAPNGAVPPYVFGGAFVARTERAVYSLAVYGGDNARGGLDFGEAFDDGYLISGGITIPVNPRGMPGLHSISVVWGDREIGNLLNLGDLLPPGAVGTLQGIDTGRLLVRYSFHQQLGCWGGDRDRTWGLWGRFQIGENNLTAVALSAAAGIGGTSPFPGREHDRWGLGGFYFSFADFLGDPAIVNTPLEDEYGFEFFYNARLTPWLRLTADLQVIDPAIPGNDVAVLAGLRATVRF